MAQHSIVVLPSHREGMPWTILEAMALRKPVVASEVGGVSEIVVDGQTGFLVQPGQPESLARKIIHLLNDPELRGQMGNAGRRRVEQCFTVKDTIAKIELIWDEYLNSRVSTRR
jgi:glycosyltransferase involved in cell wall biosynthesis